MRLGELQAALSGTPLAAGWGNGAERFVERTAADGAELSDAAGMGLARLLASQAETAAYLSNRGDWLDALLRAEAAGLEERGQLLHPTAGSFLELPLEDALDALRLRRRDEMALAACLDLAGLESFAAVSVFLSQLAEATTRDALALARRELSGPDLGDDFAVIGMGKVAGSEFTYHSDLDLIFLFRGDTEHIARATRMGQRLISYLTTQTGAGIAYEVDTRLRPSGQQGMLVTSFDGYERYQTRQAATWEHLAMLRARPIAGAVQEAAERLSRVREQVLPTEQPPWPELASLRQRVVAERAAGDDGVRAFKTGPGGLMDVDFLAGGGILERGAQPYPDPPSVERMLAASLGGAPPEELLADYQLLRRVEARGRWAAGRGLEALPDDLETIAELVEPGLEPAALETRLRQARQRIRGAYDRVIAAESIAALEG